MRRAVVWAAAAVVALSGLTATAAFGHTGAKARHLSIHGYDVSWPQCSSRAATHMPKGSPSYVILGLTHGAGHTANPCLDSQLGWARSHHVRVGAYLVASYPDRAQRRHAKTGPFGACVHSQQCRLKNDGAAQAQDALATMRTAGLVSPRVWIDVEFRHTLGWWHSNHANAAVIKGIVRELQDSGMPTGVYTTPYMWHDIVGGYRVNVPNWLPIGHRGAKAALRLCDATATGGATWLVQYTHALDKDRSCPTLNSTPGVRSPLWPYRNLTLQRGSEGPAVSALQGQLGQPETGEYDAVTALAVQRWQLTKQLDATGEMTPTDWRAMGALGRRGSHRQLLSQIAN